MRLRRVDETSPWTGLYQASGELLFSSPQGQVSTEVPPTFKSYATGHDVHILGRAGERAVGLWLTLGAPDGSTMTAISVSYPIPNANRTTTLYVDPALPWLGQAVGQTARSVVTGTALGIAATHPQASVWQWTVEPHGDPPPWLTRATMTFAADAPSPPFTTLDISVSATSQEGSLLGKLHLTRLAAASDEHAP